MTKTYRMTEWKAVVSGPSKLAISSYVEDYERSGYETEIKHESDGFRLYVRIPVTDFRSVYAQ